MYLVNINLHHTSVQEMSISRCLHSLKEKNYHNWASYSNTCPRQVSNFIYSWRFCQYSLSIIFLDFIVWPIKKTRCVSKICIGRANIKENMHPQKHGLHKLCEHWCPRKIMTPSVLSTSLILKIDFWPENKETSKNTNVGKHWELVLGLDKC